jgi:hypothetical protein
MTCPLCKSQSISGVPLNNGSIIHRDCFDRINNQIESTRIKINSLRIQIYELESKLKESENLIGVISRILIGGTTPDFIRNQIYDLKDSLKKSENEITLEIRNVEPLFDLMLDYPPDWNQRVEKVKERDRVCTSCGSHRFLQVHHITRLSKGGSNKISNLIMLCENCHKKEHGGRDFKYTGASGNLAISDRVEVIQQAITFGKNIEFQYKKPDESSFHKRTIKPISLTNYDHTTTDEITLCVEGYCYMRKSNRVFALKRMKGLKQI